MEYRYSTIVDPSTYETDGLCNGYDLRKHKYGFLEDRGAIRAYRDWTRLVGPITKYRGDLGPVHNFLEACVPECLPDRLEIISYATEFAFLYDDAMELVDPKDKEGVIENDKMVSAFLEGAQTGKIDIQDAETMQATKRRIQSQILLEMIALDRECAIAMMKAWAESLDAGSNRKHQQEFSTLEEYLDYRTLDAGEMFTFGLVTFGLGLKIDEKDIPKCRELTKSAFRGLSLQNDLYSYEKELEAASHQNSFITNALEVLKLEHNTDLRGAREICRQLIKQYGAEYLEIVKRVKQDKSLPVGVRHYVEATQYCYSGNLVWSMTCPRYNREVSLNKKQLDWIRNGLPELDSSYMSRISNPTKVAPENSYWDSNNSLYKLEDKSSGTTGGDISGIKSANREVVKGSYRYIALPSKGIRPKFIDTLSYWFNVPYYTASRIKTTINLLIQSVAYSDLTELLYESEEKSSETIDGDVPGAILAKEIVEAPYHYIASLPSKGIRDKFIDALNYWLKVPHHTVGQIKTTINLLHQASLDDFQDSSPLRRGKPATHTIFGAPQTINTSGYCIVKAIEEIQLLGNPQNAMGRLLNLYEGQALDLHWTFNGICPTEEEYMEMIDCKTGAQFELVVQLMQAHRTASTQADLSTLTKLLGRYFQIADDYKNLVSPDYSKQKGFCEDLDEGKYSLPLIHVLQSQPENLQLRNILCTRRSMGKMMHEQKQLVLEYLREAKSLEYTHSTLMDLHVRIGKQIDGLEWMFGEPNVELRLLWELLRV
ncbi:hypothetical protein D9757_008668 [Collybiopsis confluens]|uniref:(2E,6E)-farnesyl diphosphate synthase n=1 Tax=Collybiopsis confluens TaxID=2823264 RepID=A0A8H5M0H9_9AGAR|nr:hypothetical protein D9757_008668 [Collybiopsis confluens]